MKKLMWMAVIAMAFVSCQSGNKKNAEEVMENMLSYLEKKT